MKRSISFLIDKIKLISRLWHFEGLDGHQAVIRLRQPILPIVFLVLLLWYIAAPTNVIIMSVGMLGGLLIVSYIWARKMAANVVCNRKLHYTAFQVGDELEEFVTLTNHSNLPVLWAEFKDHSSIPDYTISSVQATGGGSTTEWRARTICSRRGVYSLGPWEVQMADPFSVFSVHKYYEQREEVIVYPPLAAIPRHLIPRSSAVGSHRPLYQPLSAETTNAVQTRAYIPGDPLRRIHWKSTARHESLFVKVFEPESTSSIWLVPDLDAGVQLGEGSQSTLEMGIILIASLAARILEERLAVGLFALGAQPQIVVPQRGRVHLWSILRALSFLDVLQGESFSETLSQARSVIPDHDLLIAVTPSLSVDWSNALHHVPGNRRSGYTQAILLDPPSFGGSGNSKLLLPGLLELGVDASLIRREDIRPILGAHGALRRWEFTSFGTGRVHVRQVPRLAEVFAGQKEHIGTQ